MTQPASWFNRSLFVSSTFNDMHAERDYLQQFVFPEIAEKLRIYNYHLEVLDFRWGIDTVTLTEQQAKERLVLKVCLNEIDRSRPFMIILLGDRYGWMPGEERIKTAANEAQLDIKNVDISVTALEIEYGVLKNKTGALRSFFYLRHPLPYIKMQAATANIYSDEFTNQSSFNALQQMKKMLKETYPENVRDYPVEWDDTTNTITGLETFGDLVKKDLWNAINEELQLGRIHLPGWQEQEQKLLETFTEENCRNFSGREILLAKLMETYSNKNSAAKEPVTMLQGLSGSGKSAVFSMLYRTVQQQSKMLLLSHSAGVSPQSILVSRMLQKFCYQLCAFLNIQNYSEKKQGYDELKQYFRELLQQAASVKPVLLMVDAAEQFERTTAAKYITWLPGLKEWPANVFLFITVGMDTTEAAVIKSVNSNYTLLPPFSVNESDQLAETICSHYHKVLPGAVKKTLLEKQTNENIPASGSPFWLTLTVNELLLLDTDDFSRTKDFTGSPEQQLQQLLIQVVKDIPATIHGAINYLFERIESTYGKEYVSNILLFISITREGVREKDLRALQNATSNQPWDSVLFAAIRRALRMQMRQQGETGKWIFTHRLIYEVAAQRYYNTKAEKIKRHQQMADYLASLPADDDMKSELLYHMLYSNDVSGVCNYLIRTDKDLLKISDYYILSSFLKEMEKENSVQWLTGLMNNPLTDASWKDEYRYSYLYFLTQKLMEFIEVMRFENGIEFSLTLATGIAGFIEKHLEKNAGDNMSRECFYRLLQIIAQLQSMLGEEDSSLENSIKAAGINEEFVKHWGLSLEKSDGMTEQERQVKTIFYHNSKRDLMLNHINIAEYYINKSDHKNAIELLNKALNISKWFNNIYPDSPLSKFDMANNHIKISSILIDEGDFRNSSVHCQESIKLCEWLVKKDPEKIDYQILLVDSYRNIGKVLSAIPDPVNAEKYYKAAYSFSKKLKEQNPGEERIQWKFLFLQKQMGEFYMKEKDIVKAENCYGESVQTLTLMANLFSDKKNMTNHLKYCFQQLMKIKLIQGDTELAAKYKHYSDTL